ncbi:MAG: ribonuclease Z [Candidatus Omnitrophota bacterium]
MKIIFLGTNGWYDTDTGNTLCVLIETHSEFIVLDAGNGIYKLDKYIKSGKPIFLFISHMHLDHLIGLHVLNKFNFKQGINIFGPPGTRKSLSLLINKPFSLRIKQLVTKIKINDLNKGTRLPLDMQFRKLRHTALCYGYRFNLEGKIITFCTDTGLCPNLFKLAEGADLFIAECSLRPGQVNEEWPHLNPQMAAAAASKAKVKRLALVHFDAALFTDFHMRKSAEKHAKTAFKNTFSALDGQAVVL